MHSMHDPISKCIESIKEEMKQGISQHKKSKNEQQNYYTDIGLTHI